MTDGITGHWRSVWEEIEMESTIVYFEKAGPDNTDKTLDLAVNAATVY
ncbi:MAG: hypothetical protein ACOCZ7_02380 [Armatimonadota bacterium]